MKKVKIQGQEFTLRNGDEVTYGAQKGVAEIKEAAQIELLPSQTIIDILQKKGGGKAEELSDKNLIDLIPEEDLKKTLVAAMKGGIPPVEEAIMLSANIPRDDIFEMPARMVEELAKAANNELGGLLNFTKPSISDTT